MSLPADHPPPLALTPEPPPGPDHPLLRGLLLLVLAGVCALLQARQPAYLLGPEPLVPLALVLGLATAAGLARGWPALTAALAGATLGALLRAQPTHLALSAVLLTAAQALLAIALMRRAADPDALQLDTGGRLRRLVFKAAPAAALLGAAGSLLTLLMPGPEGAPVTLGGRALLAHALGRWTVDWAGIVLCSALLLAWWARPAEVWRPRRRALALPLGVVLVGLLFGLHQVAQRDEVRLQVRFDADGTARARQLQQLLNEPIAAVSAARGVLAAAGTQGATSQLIDGLASSWSSRIPGLRALGWLELPQGDGSPPPRLAHVHTLRTPEPALARALGGSADTGHSGSGLTLPPPVQQALARALAAEPAATAWWATPTEGSWLMVLQALPAADGQRRIAFGLVDLLQHLDPALPEPQDLNLLVCLYDNPPARLLGGTRPGGPPPAAGAGHSTDGPAQVWAGPPACAASPRAGAYRSHVAQLSVGDRKLDLLSVEPPTADNRLFTSVWLLGLPSVFGLGLLASLLLALTGRLHRIEDRVRERTLALQTEIDVRRAAETALGQSEQRFRAIFESVNIGVTLVGTDGRIQMVNPAFCAMMGAGVRELIGQALDEIRLPDVAGDDGTAQAVGGGAATRQRYLTRDGRVLQVAASVRALHDAVGEPVGTVFALHDLTQVLQLREAERERDEAAVANRTKNEFLSRLSHELRAPLNAIVGFAQMVDDTDVGTLDGDLASPRLKRNLSQIRQAGWHLLDMVNDVMDLSRMEAGTLRLTLEPVRLPDLVQDGLAMLEATAQQADVALSLSLSPQVEWVQADPLRLRQVLLNLVGNAVKYNRPGGRVEVRTRPGGVGELLIEVEDTGVGIAGDQIEALFRPFHRLGRDRGSAVPGALQEQGTGIGLVICRHLVALMGGQLEVSSQPGEGSVFTVRLPRAAGPNAAHVSVQSQSALGSQVSIGQVLYIEDNPADVDAVRELLRQCPGITLQVAATAAEGLARATEADVLLLDLDLPDQPGLSLLGQLRAEPRLKSLPVVVVSAETRPERIDACFDAGATAFFSKPLDAAPFLRALDDALRH